MLVFVGQGDDQLDGVLLDVGQGLGLVGIVGFQLLVAFRHIVVHVSFHISRICVSSEHDWLGKFPIGGNIQSHRMFQRGSVVKLDYFFFWQVWFSF